MKLTQEQKEKILEAIYEELASEQLDIAIKLREKIIKIVEELPH